MVVEEGRGENILSGLIEGGIEIDFGGGKKLLKDIRSFVNEMAVNDGVTSGGCKFAKGDSGIDKRCGTGDKMFQAIVHAVLENIRLSDGQVVGVKYFEVFLKMVVEPVMADQTVADTLVVPTRPFEKPARQQAGPAVEAIAHAVVAREVRIGGKDVLVHEYRRFLADNYKEIDCNEDAGKGVRAQLSSVLNRLMPLRGKLGWLLFHNHL